ncbi:hypothetical protein DTO169E5_8672 [Paecilomyces variotii]|nr:hypothetical protein DTO169E5_8672 [Paecilomyces variotii]
MSAAVASSSTVNSQAQGVRQPVRQTRTNPSRTSKTLSRSSFAYGHSSVTDAPPTPTIPHGFYPALSHFTDAVAALPREFRRHNSLLKEVDAKAWALEENLLQLLKTASDSEPVPYPPNPAPIVDGFIREDAQPKDASQIPESHESKNRRLLFDRVRHTLTDLMMTADEKNHVLTNANEELDRQLFRLDTVFPYISGEISEESRLGSLTHWAYSNKSAAKDARSTNERPRREAAKQDLAALHEAEAASRSEARREAVLARKQRRAHQDSDFDEARVGRKGAGAKARGGAGADHAAEQTGLGIAGTATAPTKRRKVERPQPVQTGAAMERSLSGVTAGGRAHSKDAPAAETKKRARASNAPATNGRKRNNTTTAGPGSPSLVSSPVIGTFNAPRNAPSPGPNTTARPQSSRAQPNNNQASNSRQRPPSSASNRANNGNKSAETKPPVKEGTKEATPHAGAEATPDVMDTADDAATAPASVATKREGTEQASVEPSPAGIERADPAPPSAPAAKGRASKNSTPVATTFSEATQQRSRPSRNTDTAGVKRAKKGLALVQQAAAATEDEESSREGDDEDDDGEPRYCYCNEISFGEMVACDNDACPREWFHLSCVGLTKPPGKNVKWYCNECKENMRRGRSSGK